MGGETTAIDNIITAIVNLGSSVADAVISMVTQLLPIFGPVIASTIVIFLGYKLIRRFSSR